MSPRNALSGDTPSDLCAAGAPLEWTWPPTTTLVSIQEALIHTQRLIQMCMWKCVRNVLLQKGTLASTSGSLGYRTLPRKKTKRRSVTTSAAVHVFVSPLDELVSRPFHQVRAIQGKGCSRLAQNLQQHHRQHHRLEPPLATTKKNDHLRRCLRQSTVPWLAPEPTEH